MRTQNLCCLRLFSALLAAALLFAPTTIVSGETGDEFSYRKGDPRGPDRWGDLRKEWEACGRGRLQSPVDLSDEEAVVQDFAALDRRYLPSEAKVINRGHDIMVKLVGRAGVLRVAGADYALQQVHWHMPSEHTVNGQRYDLEMHMVHSSADNRNAVVGVLYRLGEPDPFLAKMEKYIREVKDVEGGEVGAGVADPKQAGGEERAEGYYAYVGSLTTPPCTEGVLWTVLQKVRTVSMEQVRLLREAVTNGYEENARPSQPTGGRLVQFYRAPSSVSSMWTELKHERFHE